MERKGQLILQDIRVKDASEDVAWQSDEMRQASFFKPRGQRPWTCERACSKTLLCGAVAGTSRANVNARHVYKHKACLAPSRAPPATRATRAPNGRHFCCASSLGLTAVAKLYADGLGLASTLRGDRWRRVDSQ